MCGFIGIYGPEGVDVAPELYEGLLAVQHRGQDAAGITTFTDTFHVRKGFGLVRDVFTAADMGRLCGNLGVAHVRYPTVGTGSHEDAQPFHVNFPVGVAMAHNGNVTNFQELKEMTMRNACTRLNSSCDLEVILYVFARALSERIRPGERVTPDDVFRAVEAVFNEVRGAYSVVALVPDVGMVAFRDPFGIKPAMLGKKDTPEGVCYAATSESVVLDVIGYERVGDIAAGEAILIDDQRELHRKQITTKPHRPCVFELVYFARPDSMLDEISVYKTRIRFGQELARQWRESGAPAPDVVIPIPDSSRDAAMAMAAELGVPYREGLVKNRYIGRTFIMPSQASRRNSVRRKLNAIPLEFEGKNVLLVDDSIVRGNTARRIVKMAREAGAKRVYMAITSPPLTSPCPYGIDMATKTEFIAGGRTVDEVAEALGSDHVVYLERDRMNEAARRGNPEVKEFCNACFTGEYPTGDITREVLEAIEGERHESSQKIFSFTPE
ncbi:MAG: amidophosphoribosyltransferase [Planctomycetota bacterium]